MRYPISALLLALSLSGLVQAAPQAPKFSRPSGPITITAKSGEWQDGVMIYTGDVAMLSNTLELRGARLELRQPGGSKSPYEIILTGEPATMKHAAETPKDQPVQAQAKKIVYQSSSQDVELSGSAQLARGKDEINGDNVRYNVPARRVQANGGDAGQVRIVLDVPEETGSGTAPSPAAPPAGAPTTPPPPSP